MSVAPELGTATQVDRTEGYRLALSMILLGAIFIMAVYHFAVFALRRSDRSPLYFASLCLLIAARILVTGQHVLIHLIPHLPWGIELRIEYTADYLALPAFLLFLRSLYPQEVPLPVVRSAQIVGLLGMASLTIPLWISSLAVPPYELIVTTVIVFCLVALVAAVLRRRDGAALFLAGCAVFFATLVHDFLVYNLVIVSGELLPFGLCVLILVQSAILARRFSAALTDLRQSQRMVTARDRQLRKQIAELLHGSVQSLLLGAGLRLAEAERGLAEAERGLASDHAQALDLVAAARADVNRVREQDVRKASHLLHPSVIEVGLAPAVRSLAARFEGHLAVDVRVDPTLNVMDQALPPVLPEGLRLAAYRVVEEALGNVVAHSGARSVEISLGVASRQLRIQVRDDGRGLNDRRVKLGLGLRCIAAWVGEMEGGWEVHGRPGRGTTPSAWWPLRGR